MRRQDFVPLIMLTG